ncbi:MAG: glycoside hydrolase family 172 protein [Promethearchaeota archaeon]
MNPEKMSNLEELALSREITWKVKQVSTHRHDEKVISTFLMPEWRKFAKKGLKHRDFVEIKPKESHEFPVLEGPGCIVNMWFTFTPYNISNVIKYCNPWKARKQIKIKIFFDGNKTPDVDCPIGDFFGVGFGEYKEYQSKHLEETSGGYVCRFPMPFEKDARIVIENTNEKHMVRAFYGAITYKQYFDTFKNKFHYFHARYREERPTTMEIPYKILDIKGEGFLAGFLLNQENTTRGQGLRFLEGNTKIFVDGENTPSLEYTGTEDVFQGAWYYVHGEYSARYSGLNVRSLNKLGIVKATILSNLLKNKVSQYRFYEHDAIPFKKSLLIFTHHGEFDEIQTNQSSVVYFYAKKPASINLEPLKKGEFLDEYYSI